MAAGRKQQAESWDTFEDGERTSSVQLVESVPSEPSSPGAAAFALHDAKNMLGVITANVDFLTAELRGPSASPDVVGALDDLRVSAARIRSLLREAIVALRGEDERPRSSAEVRLVPLVSAAVSRFRRRAEAAGVRLEVHAEVNPGARIAPDLLERILDNLLDNALRFSKAGDTIELTCSMRDRRAVVTVSDEGPGVPEEAREAIFSAYRACTQPEGGHFGLGLAFCRAVARAYGGDVHIENRLGGGACFVLEVA